MKLKQGFICLLTLIALVAISGASEAVKGLQTDIDNFKKEMTEKINSVEKQISELKEKSKKQKDMAADKTAKTIRELEVGRDKFRSELNDLKSDSEQKWKRAKKDLGDSFADLNSKIQKALKD
jgi:predicted phage tail protein